MRTSRGVAVALSISSLVVLGSESLARAGTCDQPIVGACINSDTLWPHFGPSRFVGVGGTETLAPGKVGFGLVTSYQSRPIVLHIPSPGPSGSNLNAVNDQVTSTFVFGYGVTKQLELGVAMPLTLGQGGSGTSGITAGQDLRDTAVRDLRFGAAYSLLPHDRVEPSLAKLAKPDAPRPSAFGLAVRFEVSAPTGDRGQFAGEKSAVFNPTIAADYRRGRWFAGLELGARIRKTSEFVGARVGTQGTVGVGVGFDIFSRERLSAMVEARALPTFAEQHKASPSTNGGVVSEPNGKHITPAEWSVGVRSAPFAGSDLALTASGGAAIPFGGEAAITAPRFRFVLGIAYAPRGLDSDGDGVLDADDKCPSVPGSKDAPDKGCVMPPPPPPEPVDTDFTAPAPAAAPAPPPQPAPANPPPAAP
jgi:OOP family OmpA-OmpF porin